MAPKKNVKPVIGTWCKACGLCVAFCPKKVFDADEFGRPIVKRPEDCTGCNLCDFRCPDFAITFVEQ